MGSDIKDIIVSVIVCTFNRSYLLQKCLESLDNQTAEKSIYEVIIIDNNSTDDTKEISQKFIDNNLNFRYAVETNQGLSHARNRGYMEAKGNYVAYIDDDAIAEPDWIEKILCFIESHPKAKIFGGPYDRYSLKEIPKWLPENFGKKIIDIESNSSEFIINGKGYLSGTNMIFEKELLMLFGGFDTAVGMKGYELSYGEETELQKRIMSKGYNIYYLKDLVVKHLVQESKFKLTFHLKSAYGFGKVSEKILNHGLNRSLLSSLLRVFKALLYFFWKLFEPVNKPLKRRLLVSLRDLFNASGSLVTYVKSKKSLK